MQSINLQTIQTDIQLPITCILLIMTGTLEMLDYHQWPQCIGIQPF